MLNVRDVIRRLSYLATSGAASIEIFKETGQRIWKALKAGRILSAKQLCDVAGTIIFCGPLLHFKSKDTFLDI